MDELQVFNNISFGQVRVQELDNEVWFVAKDVCECLGINDTSKAVGRLDEDEKGTNSIPTPGGNQNLLTVNEYGLYSMVLSSRKPEALRAYADEVESHNATKAIVAQQEQQIAEFKPVKDYVDKILSSKSCLTITQIAADYGLSAQELNKILHEAGLQRKVGDQWILYKQHMAKGFTKSETFTFCRSDGRLDSKITTKWTQKGRLEIHSILTKLNIHAVCEDVA